MNQTQLEKQKLENMLKKLENEKRILEQSMSTIAHSARNNHEKQLKLKRNEINEVLKQKKQLENSMLTKQKRKIKNLETRLSVLKSKLNTQEIVFRQVTSGNNPSSPHFKKYRNDIASRQKEIRQVEKELNSLKKKPK